MYNFNPVALGYERKEYGFFKEQPVNDVPVNTYEIQYKLQAAIGELVTPGGTVPFKAKTDYATGISEADAKINAQKKLDDKWAGSVVIIDSVTDTGFPYEENNPVIVHWITLFEDGKDGKVQLYAYMKGTEEKFPDDGDQYVYNTQIVKLTGQDELAKLVEIFTRK
jgi:hypothetical protein